MGLDHEDGYTGDPIEEALDKLVQVITEPATGANSELTPQEQKALEQLVKRVKAQEYYRLLHE